MADKHTQLGSQPVATKSITIDVPSGQRLGQAIINALKASGDLRQLESSTAVNGQRTYHKVTYIVDGADLFYLTDSELQEKLTDMATPDPETTTTPPQIRQEQI